MGSFFFDGEHMGALFFHISPVFLDHLIIPAVHSIKWIAQAMENRLMFSFSFHMHWENPESGRFPFSYFARFKKTTGELERMTNEQHVLLIGFTGYFVVFHQPMEPIHVFGIPGNAFGFQRAARTTAG